MIIHNDTRRVFRETGEQEPLTTTYVFFESTESIEKVQRVLMTLEAKASLIYNVLDMEDAAQQITEHLSKVKRGLEVDLSPGVPPAGPVSDPWTSQR